MKPYIPIIIVCILIMSGFGVASTTNNLVKMDNHPPYVPSNFYPDGEDIYYDIDINLSWDGGDPDQDDTVTYNIYLDTNSNPDWVATVGPYPANQTRIQYKPDTLKYCKWYYWKIISRDNHGASTASPVWMFRTICPLEPPAIYGPTSGKVGVEYEYTFYSPCNENNYVFCVYWGDGSPTEFVAPDLPNPEGGRIGKANHSWEIKGTYHIKAYTRDIYGRESDWGYLEVSMPKSNNPIWWLNGLLDRFPLLQRFLDALGWLG